VSEIDEVGKAVEVVSDVEPATPESKPSSDGLFSGFFSSSLPKEEVKNPEEEEVPSELNDAMIVEKSDTSEEQSSNDELNTGMIADESDKEMIDTLKLESEEPINKGGKSRKYKKQQNSKSKKLRGGRNTKKRQQKKGGAKKSKRRSQNKQN
jgi:hypothetical protein